MKARGLTGGGLNGDEVNRDGIGVERGKPAADNTVPAPELQEIQQRIRKLKPEAKIRKKSRR